MPIVASRTPATSWILNNRGHHLVEPGHADQLCSAMDRLIDIGRIDYGKQTDWSVNCNILEQALIEHG